MSLACSGKYHWDPVSVVSELLDKTSDHINTQRLHDMHNYIMLVAGIKIYSSFIENTQERQLQKLPQLA